LGPYEDLLDDVVEKHGEFSDKVMKKLRELKSRDDGIDVLSEADVIV
jgi:hypothetical protein